MTQTPAGNACGELGGAGAADYHGVSGSSSSGGGRRKLLRQRSQGSSSAWPPPRAAVGGRGEPQISGILPARRLQGTVPAKRGILASERCIEAHVQAALAAAKKETSFTVQNFPVFLLQTPRGYWYGFPTFGHPGMKIGKFYHLWEESQPDSLSRVITAADEEVLREPVREYFPDANGALTKAAACMFTMTPDGHFIVDLHPVHPEVVICSACSGHGFKFCSVIGEILADLATRGSTGFDISMLLLNPAREGHTDVIKELTSRLSENS
eukprot:jgi/Botrbrau1/8885/Bobra.0148s0005.1